MCFALNGGFAALLLKRINPNILFTSIGSLFYSAFPPTIGRITSHNSLGAIWLFIAAMILCLDHKKEYKKKFTPMVLWSVLCMLAVLIHTYFVPMIFMVMTGYVVLIVFRDKRPKKAAAVFGSSVGSTLLTMWLIGAFYGKGSYSDGGFGLYSSNLNTYFNSRGLSNFLTPLKSFEGQYEGFGYLGLGMLLCVFLGLMVLLCKIEQKGEGLIKGTSTLIKKYNIEVIAFLSIFAFSFFWAVSNRITIGDKLILEIPLTYYYRYAFNIFRASGRFIWVSCVLIMTAALWLVSKLPRKSSIIAVALCVVLQMLDISSWCIKLNTQYSRQPDYEFALQDEKWDELTSDTKEIIFVPMNNLSLDYLQMYFDFAQLALEKDLTLSSFYLARLDLQSCINSSCREYELLKEGKGRIDALYVFFNEEDVIDETEHVKIYEVDGYFVAKVK